MNFGWVRPLLVKTGRSIVKNSPHILMGVGTTTSILGVIFAVKAAPTANKALETAKEKADGNKLTVGETIKTAGQYYIPAALMEMLALTCFWSAHRIDIHRQAVLAGLCSTAQEALIEYQRKTKSLLGEKVEREISNDIAQDKADKLPPPPDRNPLPPGASDRWCVICNGGVTSPYFLSNYVKIKSAENDINHEMLVNMYSSESDLYWLLDPDRRWLKTDGYSGQVGWDVDKMLVLDVRECDGPDHEPIYVISYKDKDGCEYMPSPGFSKLH